MKEVFELQSNNDENVILKVNADDPLTVAEHPYVCSNMAYITVTKGKKHILTTILKDGKHGVRFDWGDGGYTLISDGLSLLKKKVLEFIEGCGICIDLTHAITSACLYFNSNFGSWQLTLNDHEGHIWENKKCGSFSRAGADDWGHGIAWGTEKLQSLLNTIRDIDWIHKIAQTGIDMWEAVI